MFTGQIGVGQRNVTDAKVAFERQSSVRTQLTYIIERLNVRGIGNDVIPGVGL